MLSISLFLGYNPSSKKIKSYKVNGELLIMVIFAGHAIIS